MNKLVSVILPSYNGEKYIKEAINSIIAQTYTNWELIIVDDCSKDNTFEIASLCAKKDKRIKIIRNNKNKKLPASLNIGFKMAKGEYFSWSSDDNIYYPQAFEKMVSFLDNNPDFGMVFACENIEKNGIIQDEIWCNHKLTPELLLKISVPGACFMYRADIAHQVGEYNENYFLNEDHNYWLRMLLKTKIGNISDILYLYRFKKDSLTNTRKEEIKKGKIKLLREFRKIYKEVFLNIEENLKPEYLTDMLLEGEIAPREIKKDDKNKVYKILKYEYKYLNDKIYLNIIKGLGFEYFLKMNIYLMFYKFKNIVKIFKKRENNYE